MKLETALDLIKMILLLDLFKEIQRKRSKSPKLIKGPDRFLTIVLSLKKEKNNLKVLLAGTRRQYLINEFEKHSIDYKYIELPSF